MNSQLFIRDIRDRIARDELPAALEQLRTLLEHSPKLDEAILQSARFQNIGRQIRLGTVSHAEANLTQNQIRAGLLDLLREIEDSVGATSSRPDTAALRAELERAISIVQSKNVLVGSSISAGGNVQIGDTTIQTESKISRYLRLFLYLFVPLLALSAAFLWRQMQPVALIVTLNNRTPNPELPFQKGSLTLYHGGKPEAKTIEAEAIFTGIRRGEKVSLHFMSEGFVPVDTAFVLSEEESLTLAIRRDDSFAIFAGFISDATTGKPLEGVKVSIPCCQTVTDAFGRFEFKISPEHQRETQPFQVSKEGYEPKSLTSPVLKRDLPKILLKKVF